MLKKVFSLLDGNEREIKRLQKIVLKVNSFEENISKLSNEELRGKTEKFKSELGDEKTLNDILPEAFAVVREAAKRAIGLRPFDVQMMGGIVLHEGRIAEMKTGEGKTLAAIMPLYLNALEGKGCHLVTVNDYLAKRDRDWMAPIFELLGLTVGVIVHELDNEERREAYNCDITYGTNNEFGFDFLRDNMVNSFKEMVQRDLQYAIVDEVDSILIDEARTPLIISGVAEKPTELYYKFSRIIPRLKNETDFTVDEKAQAASFTEEGTKKIENIIGVQNLSEPENIELFHHANCALRAYTLMKKDVDYVVKDGEVIIVDENTGRLMYGRRYSEGLHQAIEAKENVKIENESQTLATITFQNYFRLYKKLAGMTGTAKTEEKEFRDIYLVDVVVIPTHKPMIRKDYADLVYKSEESKFRAIVAEIRECHKKGQPVLVGTRSVEKSEKLSRMLHSKGLVRIDWKKYAEEKLQELKDAHFVLNAKEHEHEAKIIARAGQKGAVTIATNMAGRGVDIVLGKGVIEVGGLHIIGTERHESRRIDNQLRGRSGRQGDPGSSRFYVSLEDELMRIFGGDKVKSMMEFAKYEEDMPLEHSLLTKLIANVQSKVESRHYSMRKSVLDYDDVMEKQRGIIYGERKKILQGVDVKKNILEMLSKSIEKIVANFCPPEINRSDWDLGGLKNSYLELIPVDKKNLTEKILADKIEEEMQELLFSKAEQIYNQREEELGAENMRELERQVMLRVIDEKWIEHLDAMDYLREGIGLRAYGQMDPLIAYHKEAKIMFDALTEEIQDEVVKLILRVQAQWSKELKVRAISFGKGEEMDNSLSESAAPPQQTVRVENRVKPNDPCSCGSGKKYKRCCGKKAVV